MFYFLFNLFSLTILQGLDSDTTEVVCQADITSAITSGGGFSIFYPQPSYQTDAINAYFQAANDAGTTPNIGYNAKGRGYPDIALAGLNYAVVLGQSFYKISGTSASAPAVAGMFSSINAARMALGKGPVGFIHPALYMNSDSYVNDITSGDNHCAATGRCCQQGFWAGPGWDPITGLGSLNYKKLEAVFVKLGTVNSANREPTARPSLRPTLPPTGRPTSASKAPMAKRGDSPSNTPTAMPSGPTRNPVPSLSPTSSPSVYSSAKPTFNPTEFPTDQVQSAGTSGGPSYSTITTFEAYQVRLYITSMHIILSLLRSQLNAIKANYYCCDHS